MTEGNGRFPAEPWVVREVGLDTEAMAQSESLFALSNGHIGVRGNLDEGDPNGLPGTYLNSFYETRPLPYAEAGYGYPESGQTVLNVTNGKLIRLLVDDEPLDLRYGLVVEHERVLDLRRGVLERVAVWQSPAGRRVRITSTRFVSLTRRSMLAIRYRVEPVDNNLRVVVHSELVANEQTPPRSGDPRVSEVIENALEPVEHGGSGLRALLVHRTRASKLQMAAAMDHLIDTPEGKFLSEHTAASRLGPGHGGDRAQPGPALARSRSSSTYGWSSQRSVPALRDQVSAALTSALAAGWDGVVEEQAASWRKYWDGADVEIDGPVEIQQAVRFGLFHAYQAGARAEQRAIPAKGLTGPGLRRARVLGHRELRAAAAVGDRTRTPPPTRCAGGTPPSTWPASGPRRCAWAGPRSRGGRSAGRSARRTGRPAPRRSTSTPTSRSPRPGTSGGPATTTSRANCALPILVETARLWMTLGYRGDDDQFHIDGVTGPDEYSAHGRRQHLHEPDGGAEPAGRRSPRPGAGPRTRPPSTSTPAELAAWTWSAEHVAVPYSERRRARAVARLHRARGLGLRALGRASTSTRCC